MAKVEVKFLIDKEQKRVVFAEAGSDFVDILFSFLTLPLGRIVRVLNKKSGLGSLDNLYESVEQLDVRHLQTKACKEMLLNPRSAAAIPCEELKIKNIHHPYPRHFYICKEDNCLVQYKSYYTYTSKCQCSLCGNLMDKSWQWDKRISDDKEGVFVYDPLNFLITDDLRVIPASLMKACSLLKEMQIKDASILEERAIEFGTKEALNLLQRSLVSKYALTEICFPDDACSLGSAQFSIPIKEEKTVNESKQEIILKLLINKENNNVLYAEVGEDFVNQLFSFLTFPLGSVFKFLPNTISMGGCINNLYSSAKTIGLDCFKSDICKNMLLTPKLPTFYGIKNQILEFEEITSKKLTISAGCIKCYFDNVRGNFSSCIHGIRKAEMIEQNPKLTKELTDTGGDFVASSKTFMVADNLHISLPSKKLTISAMGSGMHLPVSDLNIKEVCLDKNKVRLLMGAMLISKSVLSDVFSPSKSSRGQANAFMHNL